jgi:hypothetical protein
VPEGQCTFYAETSMPRNKMPKQTLPAVGNHYLTKANLAVAPHRINYKNLLSLVFCLDGGAV